MKNASKVHPDIVEHIRTHFWNCGICGTDRLKYSITRKGGIQGHCPVCGYTFYWNDPNVLMRKHPWFYKNREKPIRKKCKNGWISLWYPKARVREFVPPKE